MWASTAKRVSGRGPAEPARTEIYFLNVPVLLAVCGRRASAWHSSFFAKLPVRFSLLNSSEHYFSLSFSFAGGTVREDFAGGDFDAAGGGSAGAASILSVADFVTGPVPLCRRHCARVYV